MTFCSLFCVAFLSRVYTPWLELMIARGGWRLSNWDVKIKLLGVSFLLFHLSFWLFFSSFFLSISVKVFCLLFDWDWILIFLCLFFPPVGVEWGIYRFLLLLFLSFQLHTFLLTLLYLSSLLFSSFYYFLLSSLLLPISHNLREISDIHLSAEKIQTCYPNSISSLFVFMGTTSPSWIQTVIFRFHESDFTPGGELGARVYIRILCYMPWLCLSFYLS